MPTRTTWVNPELFLQHNSVNVYHTYKDDDVDQGVNSFWFTTDKMGNEADDNMFDVRDLEGGKRLTRECPRSMSGVPQGEYWDKLKAQWDAWQNGGRIAIMREVIKAAIESERLVAPPDAEPEESKSVHVATIQIAVAAGNKSEAADVLTECLTNNLMVDKVIVDWEYQDSDPTVEESVWRDTGKDPADVEEGEAFR